MNMQRSIRAFTAAATFVLQVACGGGGGGSPTPFNDGATGTGASNVGCNQEYFQTMLGTYTGTVVLNRGMDNPEMCQWELTFELRGDSAVNDCRLQAVTQGSVDQQTFYPNDVFDRYQCLDESGTRSVHEPIANTFAPNVYPGLDNSYYPVEIEVFSNTELKSGPYFGDESVITEYVQLFDSVTTKIVDTVVVEGDGTMSLRYGGQLVGTLVKGD